jgi:hypothetical protein
MFYGAIVPPGKKGCPFVPGGEAQNSILHLSQVSNYENENACLRAHRCRMVSPCMHRAGCCTLAAVANPFLMGRMN